jgi:hypothetical protein
MGHVAASLMFDNGKNTGLLLPLELFRPIPVWAFTLRADAGLFLIPRDPFVAAPTPTTEDNHFNHTQRFCRFLPCHIRTPLLSEILS